MYHEMLFLQAELAREQEIKFSHTEWDQLGTKKIKYHFPHLSRNLVSVSCIQSKSFFHPPPPPLQVNKKCCLKVVY